MNQLIFYSFLLISLMANCHAEDINYPAELIINWKHKSFSGNTDYSITYDIALQQNVIIAESTHSASGLFSEERIDLDKPPG